MLLYRIAVRGYANDLSGIGAQRYGGRWNPKGMAALYTAESPANAMLEFLPHFPDTSAPNDLVLVTIEAPDDLVIEELHVSTLPADWNSRPSSSGSERIGREWLLKSAAAALRVPSVMLPLGKAWNLVVNPMHPQHAQLVVAEIVPLEIDPRLIKQGIRNQ
jgi:RES domain-containing protein